MREADAKGWLTPRVENEHALRHSLLPVADVYEVVASELQVAIGDLSDASILPIETWQAELFAGGHYRCGEGKKPFLVRAVYCNAQIPFSVASFEGALYVQHLAFGKGSEWLRKSALIVNLREAPKALHIAAGIIAE